MKFYRIFPLAFLAVALVGCGGDDAQAPVAPDEQLSESQVKARTDEPDAAITAGVRALKGNNIAAFLQTVMPPSKLDEMREDFAQEKIENPPSEQDRQQFEETMAKLTADDAVDQIMAEIEPQLVQMSAQIPMMMGFGQMMAQQAVQENEALTAEQKSAAQATVTAAFGKLQSINFGDPALARQAVSIVVDAARGLDLETMDEVQALSFDEALAKGGQVLAASKDVLNVYGISLDEMLDSVSTEVVSEDGDEATVKVDFSMFGAPQSTETKMVKRDGRWFSADLIEQMDAAETASDDEDTGTDG